MPDQNWLVLRRMRCFVYGSAACPANSIARRRTYEAFKYAPLEKIDKHLRPLLLEEEMDLSYSDEPREHG
jgi:hypothetical protein